MAIQIGKYKRPGIFVEEFDASIITSPAAAGGIVSLVLGFSKKGPVNTPILLQNTRDLENIFGTLDRNLERKGSYFHRTISKLLESSPVYAINLMLTSDTLDQIEYKSVSTKTDAHNDIVRQGPYRRFFNTTGFWKRDPEVFNNLVKDDPGAAGRLLAFTNLSDRYLTVFIFKAANTFGFERSLLEAYGTAEKVPLYLNPMDYASDYLIDVLVVTGDWTNYAELSVDTKWSQYFNAEGLRKTKVRDFANDRNITLLNFYEGISLIPYFKDVNGRNIFIENVINDDTDSTGLFCTFDVDKFEGDFPNGMIDLIGNNLVVNNSLVDTEQETIEFLSYKETISETIAYEHTQLDAAGGSLGQKVVSFGPSMSVLNNATWGGFGSSDRTAYLREGFVVGVDFDTTELDTTGTQSIIFGFDCASASQAYGVNVPDTWGPYYVKNSTQNFISGGVQTVTFSVTTESYSLVTGTEAHYAVAYIDGNTNAITVKKSTQDDVKPQLSANDIVLGYMSFTISNGNFQYNTLSGYSFTTWTNIGVNSDATYLPKEFVKDTDYTITNLGGGSFTLEFLSTDDVNINGGSNGDYDRHRKITMFNQLQIILESTEAYKGTMLIDYENGQKWSLANVSTTAVSDVSTNKSITFNLGVTSVPTQILNGDITLYKVDNEFTLGTHGCKTMDMEGDGATGSVSKYSDFYEAFQNGLINTGDWFYRNVLDDVIPTVTFTKKDGYDIVVFSNEGMIDGGISALKSFRIPSSLYNSGTFIIESGTVSANITDPATGNNFLSGEAYVITSDSVIDETLTNVSRMEDTSEKVYLDIFTDEDGNMELNFRDFTLDSPSLIRVADMILESNGLNNTDFGTIGIATNKDGILRIKSDKSNYKQTIEIEVPAGYTPVANKILINSSRYTELKVGDYLEAAVNETELENGEMPKKLARIQRKRAYAPDPTLTEISCDVSINKVSRKGDLQTLRYVPITDYASTLKGITLKGFRVREGSMPNGTEERQNDILNLVSQGTSLHGSLINKEAFDFRYLVDSFGLGLTERSKQQLVDICGDRLDVLGILNMPSNKMFRDSTAVNFVDSEGVVQTSFIAAGGDPESNPAFLYSFGDGRGSSCVGYFYPYVTVNDNGRPISVPPSAYVATTYMRKQNSALTTITPWTIAAGVTNGRVTNIAGVEVNFGPSDIENLNGAQINPIVFKRNRGFVIETENTGQTLYKSALSYLHVREVLIELERELSAMLLEFQWRFNTPDVRAEIKLRADSICEKYVNRNGLYNYFNKCDDENNTAEIIDNQIGVLDTYVEPIKGMGIIVNNITILRTGAIQAGGFIQS